MYELGIVKRNITRADRVATDRLGEIGATLSGTTKAYAQDDNQVVLPGYTVVNLFAAYEVAENLTLSLSVNNLFDTVGYTEAEGQNALYVARSINGRSAKATLKYSF